MQYYWCCTFLPHYSCLLFSIFISAKYTSHNTSYYVSKRWNRFLCSSPHFIQKHVPESCQTFLPSFSITRSSHHFIRFNIAFLLKCLYRSFIVICVILHSFDRHPTAVLIFSCGVVLNIHWAIHSAYFYSDVCLSCRNDDALRLFLATPTRSSISFCTPL